MVSDTSPSQYVPLVSLARSVSSFPTSYKLSVLKAVTCTIFDDYLRDEDSAKNESTMTRWSNLETYSIFNIIYSSTNKWSDWVSERLNGILARAF
jgi:hypothetical protein